jgi:hypothetical protein
MSSLEYIIDDVCLKDARDNLKISLLEKDEAYQ